MKYTVVYRLVTIKEGYERVVIRCVRITVPDRSKFYSYLAEKYGIDRPDVCLIYMGWPQTLQEHGAEITPEESPPVDPRVSQHRM
jgi:hypothetical protein